MGHALDQAIGRVAAGQPVDWEAVIRDAADQQERAALEDLRGLAHLEGEEGLPDVPPVQAGLTLGFPAQSPAGKRRRWAHLELLNEIGRGSHGIVYRAWDTRLAREVALKVLPDTDDGRATSRRRAGSLAFRTGTLSLSTARIGSMDMSASGWSF